LENIGELEERKHGREKVLVFKEGIDEILKEALKQQNQSEEFKTFSKVSDLIRLDMSEHKAPSFNGSFNQDSQIASVPKSLLTIVSLLLYGTAIKDQTKKINQAGLSIAQLIFSSSKKRNCDSQNTRNLLSRETPLQLYVASQIHATTRKKGLIQKMNQLSLCSSYERICQVESQLASAHCNLYETENVVAPSNLTKNTLTVAAIDNIDHDMSATTATTSSFHGTGLSFFQFPTEQSISRPAVVFPPEKKNEELPLSYSLH
jgi:hypothetical protein